MVIAELQKRKVFPPLKKLPFNQSRSQGQEKKPADNRSRTIDEMLMTERKYIQDLQALMVSSSFIHNDASNPNCSRTVKNSRATQ